jgi:hypothetical protein
MAGEIAKEIAATHPAGSRGDQAKEDKQPGMPGSIWQIRLNDLTLSQTMGVAAAPVLQLLDTATGSLAGHDVNSRWKLHAVCGHTIIEIEMIGANFLD